MADDVQHHHDHGHVHPPVDGPEPIDGSFAPRPDPGLVTTELEGELLLLDPRSDRVHVLDQLGTLIWRLFDGDASVDDLVADLADVFAAPADVVQSDLIALVDALRAASLLDGAEPLDARAASPPPGQEPDAGGRWRPEYLSDPPAP